MAVVVKYIPERMFGFVQDESGGTEWYFHLGDFDPKGPWPGLGHGCSRRIGFTFNWECPPPILGESVDVQLSDTMRPTDRAPRAKRVMRIAAPVMVRGQVESFDPQQGYGFVLGEDGVSYHLHRSEMLDGQFPKIGGVLVFFAGFRHGRPRACHVHICEG